MKISQRYDMKPAVTGFILIYSFLYARESLIVVIMEYHGTATADPRNKVLQSFKRRSVKIRIQAHQ